MKHFTKTADGSLRPCNNVDRYGYYLSGFQDPKDAGKLSTLELSETGSTCLVLVYDSEGNEIINPAMKGKYYHEKQG